MWHSYMPIHMIADDVIIIVHVAGCGWGRRGGAEQAADGSVCIVQGRIQPNSHTEETRRHHVAHREMTCQTEQVSSPKGANMHHPATNAIQMMNVNFFV
ncbi:MAG: hypothetical protein FRX49_06243 [Trebouxia sp. A1-2]|nr:MAG: hypothetical protein FRX49_06243 [Trebouxia sp. A1-2]